MELQAKLKRLIILTAISLSILLITYVSLSFKSFDSFFNIVLFMVIIVTDVFYILLIRQIRFNYLVKQGMKSEAKLRRLMDLTATFLSFILGTYASLCFGSFDSFFNIVLVMVIIITYIFYILLIRHIRFNYLVKQDADK